MTDKLLLRAYNPTNRVVSAKQMADILVDSIDLAEYVRDVTGTALHPQNGMFWGACPLPNHPGAETKPSFKIDPYKKLFFCFGCEGHNGKVLGGNIVQFVKEYHGVDFKGAIKILDAYSRDNNAPLVMNPAKRPYRAVCSPAPLPKYFNEDDGSGKVRFWAVSIPKHKEFDVVCQIANIPNVLDTLVKDNPPNADKLQEWGVVGRLHNMWCGRYTLISPDTDYHKKFKDGFPKHRDALIDKMKALPYCVAIIGTYSGGIAPIFVVDTKGVDPAKKPSKWMNQPAWIKVGLDKDENAQRRFLHEIIWTNPNAVPFVRTSGAT